MLGCDNVDESKSTKTVKLTTGLQVCESLNFESDTFQLSDSNDSQLDVFESLFLNNNAYQLPGNPTRENLYAFFKDLRKGYFQKDEGIDYSFVSYFLNMTYSLMSAVFQFTEVIFNNFYDGL